MELAQIIREARNARGLTMEQAAAQAGISRSYWEKLEIGKMKNPSLEKLEQIQRVVQSQSPPLAGIGKN